jgi:hypothetical protein
MGEENSVEYSGLEKWGKKKLVMHLHSWEGNIKMD